jgi:hypothetical protein
MASRRAARPARSRRQWRSISRVPGAGSDLPWRASCSAWAATTLAAIAAPASPVGAPALIARDPSRHLDLHVDAVQQGAGNAVAVAQRALRRAAALARGCPSQPQGQGFIAATSWKRAGKSAWPAAREIVIGPIRAAGAALPARAGRIPAARRGIARRNAPARFRPDAACCSRRPAPRPSSCGAGCETGRTRQRSAENCRSATAPPPLPALPRRHRRQQAGKARGQHALAGARRPHQQERMVAGRSDFQRPFRMLLALDVG